MFLNKIEYKQLNSRQKEIYNFQKISALLADYWFATIKLSDDRMWADFIAINMINQWDIKVQLKWRITFAKKYIGKWLYIWFIDQESNDVYMYPHDELLEQVNMKLKLTDSWINHWEYSFPRISKTIKEILKQYYLGSIK